MADKPNKKRAKPASKAARKLVKADVKATHKAAQARHHPLVRAASLLAEGADQPPLIAVSAGTLVIGLAARRADLARGGARMLLAHLVATGAKLAIKHTVDRTRPSHALDGTGHHLKAGNDGGHEDKSFPSGHTAGAVAVARAASRDIDGAAIPATLAAGAVAAVQAPAGNHYLSDIAVGAMIGWATEAVVSAVFDRFEPKVEAALSPAS